MLIIVESPAKAKTISKIVGSKHMVKASVGHIRGLSKAKKAPDGRSLEINGIDIDNGFAPFYEVDEAKKKVVSELKKLAKAAKDGILFATDSDREGEAISWHLAEVLGIKDKSSIRRLEFHEITKRAIDEAMANPRPLDLQLVSAQQARQVLDKLVGFKLSPVIWSVMGNRHLSAGRVQSPALHLICTREKEIQSFVPQEYWDLQGVFVNQTTNPYPNQHWYQASMEEESTSKDLESSQDLAGLFLNYTHSQGQKIPEKVTSRQQVEDLTNHLSKHFHYQVKDLSQKTEVSKTRPPFTTSTLQQAASSKLGYSPKQTMQLAQKLYEGVDIGSGPVGLITYMRTDSLNLSRESVDLARQFISREYAEYLPDNPKYYKSKSRNAQEAHEAIRPTNPGLTPDQLRSKLEPKLLKLYTLIWTQMVASQMTDEIRTRISFYLENQTLDRFAGSTAWTTHIGFKALTGEKVVTENTLNIQLGQQLDLSDLVFKQHFTKPPGRYSPASLIKKLEELGIGRPSTYASIISTLYDREYVENEKSSMRPTALGIKVNDLLTDNFAQVTSSNLTAQMEENLDRISRGEKQYHEVLNDFWWDFKQEVENKQPELSQQRDRYKATPTDVTCPTCGSDMDLRIGRFGEYFQCQTERSHQFPKNFREYEQALTEARKLYHNQTTDKKCAVCDKQIIVRVSKSSLRPYLACPDYQVGNTHTVMPISLGVCPKCLEEGRLDSKAGQLVEKKGFRGKRYIGCSLAKDVCGYIQKT